MEELFNILKTITNSTRLSTPERDRLRAHIEQRMRESKLKKSSPYQKLRSPYQISPWRNAIRSATYAITTFLVLITVGGGSLMAAAEAAQPGDKLYPVKVNFGEEVRAFLYFNPQERMDWEITRAERRLDDVKILALAGTLETNVSNEVADYLTYHADSAKAQAEDLAEHDPAASQEGQERLESTLKTYTTVLNTIKETRSVDELEPVVAVATASAQSVDAAREITRESKTENKKKKTGKELTVTERFTNLQNRLMQVASNELLQSAMVAVKDTEPKQEEVIIKEATEEPVEAIEVVENPEEAAAGPATAEDGVEMTVEETVSDEEGSAPEKAADLEIGAGDDLSTETKDTDTTAEDSTEITEIEDSEKVTAEPGNENTSTAITPEETEKSPTKTEQQGSARDIQESLIGKLLEMITQAEILEGTIDEMLKNDSDATNIKPLLEEFAQVIRELEQLTDLTEKLADPEIRGSVNELLQ